MRYGFYLPTRGPTATRDGILTLAREGERLGLHSAMVADHFVFPVESKSTYPYTLDGKHPSVGDALEPILGELERIGGSRAQLDLIEFTLLKAYVAAGRPHDARRMLQERRRGSSHPPVAGLASLH